MFHKFLILLLLICVNFSSAQVCMTTSENPNQDFQPTSRKASILANQPVCINIYFHIVRETNGTGGANPSRIPDIINNINDKFNPLDISVNSLGHSFIDDTNYYRLQYDINTNELIGFDNMIQTYSVPNAINYFRGQHLNSYL